MYTQVMGLGAIIGDIGGKINNLLSSFLELIKSNFRIFLIIAAAILIIVLLLLVLIIIRTSGPAAGNRNPGALSGDRGESIFREHDMDFFLPYEPDFVPDVLLEREPNQPWTEEDALPYWSDPLEGAERFWRQRIETGIDSLLENVP